MRWSGVFATRHAAAARGSIGGGGGGGCGREGASIRRSLVRAFQRNARPEVGDVTLIQSLLLDAIRIRTIGGAMPMGTTVTIQITINHHHYKNAWISLI